MRDKRVLAEKIGPKAEREISCSSDATDVQVSSAFIQQQTGL
jgi:hypothetical protein